MSEADGKRPIPTYGDSDVLIRVYKTGICGSDVHYLKHGRIADYTVEEPMCLGHEAAGIVVAAGKDAACIGLTVGDRVALEPGVGCGTCMVCKQGKYEVGHVCDMR